jgi:hypothetical protein
MDKKTKQQLAASAQHKRRKAEDAAAKLEYTVKLATEHVDLLRRNLKLHEMVMGKPIPTEWVEPNEVGGKGGVNFAEITQRLRALFPECEVRGYGLRLGTHQVRVVLDIPGGKLWAPGK